MLSRGVCRRDDSVVRVGAARGVPNVGVGTPRAEFIVNHSCMSSEPSLTASRKDFICFTGRMTGPSGFFESRATQPSCALASSTQLPVSLRELFFQFIRSFERW